ncbi:type VI secretion system, syringe needle protein [Malaciobacter molluscorum LMG 25693]|uniref:Type VI secretion system, syringe needle protein n=2 Tax=Malaciobacter molluscorum LMG 25693 TaxID=870501 RepID=A0AB33GMJ1_9BACT|nr:type VI secretion system tip protein TssI/VgrG [Malaciobacter molluscorum]AXX92260.1 type VI secretion system, syringe needle protein [Malaciobacter molluscorum LMG 25693]
MSSKIENITKQLRSEINQNIKARIRLINYRSDLPDILNESLSVYKLNGISKVNSPYEFEVVFVSEEFIEIEDIVDTDVELIIQDEINPIDKKSIYGKIYEASEDSVVAKKYLYKIKIVSPLYYLGLNNRYEIYHEKKVSTIFSEIINKYNQLLNINVDVKIDIKNEVTREYTTQYNQSDLEFLTMLCEEEGYSFIVEYSSNNPYNIVLCKLTEHAIINSYSSVSQFNHSKRFTATNIIEDYYDYSNPSLEYKIQTGAAITSSIKDNQSTSQLRVDIKRNNLRDKLNVLDESLYKDLDKYNKIEAKREYVKSNLIKGTSQELVINDSLNIELEDERAKKVFDVIILEVKYNGIFPNALDEYIQNVNEKKKHELQYEVEFTSIPKDIDYVPAYTIIKPKINSVQTAIVASSNSNTKEDANTIDVDEQGRIKVLFHFEENKTISCYLRYSNFFAGNNYGAQFLPRVNSEVIVSFVNGDVDKPIIIGSLYNGENKVPYNLPKDKTKSYIKTNSMPQYEHKQGYNEILFEDKQGEELLSFRAQKDLKTHVLNDEYKHIENNSKLLVENDKEETIQKDSIITVGEEERKSIKANKILTVEKESITTIKNDCEEHYKQNLETLIKQNEKTYLERDVELRIKNILHKYIQKDVTDKYLQNLFVKIGKELRVDIEDGFHLNTSDLKVQASDNCLFDGANGISFKCGSNILTVDASGIHFNTQNFVDNSANGGVSVEDVINKGAIIDLRANDSFRDYIYDIQEDEYVLRANSSLKDGTKVEASCFILGKEKEILAKEIKTISVENSKLEARFDLDEIIHLNQIPESKIKNIKGIFSWQN